MVVSELLVMEFYYTQESESSEDEITAVVLAVGSYGVALGAVLNMMVRLFWGEACSQYLDFSMLDNLGQLGPMRVLRDSINLWVMGKLETERRIEWAMYELMVGTSSTRVSTGGLGSQGIKCNNVGLCKLEADEVAGHWVVEKVRSCWRTGRTWVSRRAR